MSSLTKLETQIDDAVKKVPFQLPPNGRKMLAGALWWLSLIFGIMQLWLAWGLWHLGHYTDRLVDSVNTLNSIYGTNVVAPVQHLGMAYYLTLLVLLVDAVILLLSVSGLKGKRKSGWDLLFYSLLLNAAYGVVRIFSDVGGGFGPFLSAIISTAVGAYLLFQVRSMFMGKKAETTPEAK